MDLSEAYEQLSREIKGEILLPGEPEYEASRTIWNTRLSSHPAMIIRCKDSVDVSNCVKYFASKEIEFSVKGGGHSFAGNGISQGNPMIDLSSMKGIEIDAEEKRAFVQSGVKWGELHDRAIELGLGTTGGTVSGVGVSGYTLGGGTGYLARLHGLAIDNVQSMEVVTATGEIVSANEKVNPDLFWGLKGGSGNLGIVTQFEFRLHSTPKYIYAGQVLYSFEYAEKALLIYREVMAKAPRGFTCYACAMHVPPIPDFPKQLHGMSCICFVFAHIGDQRLGEKAAMPLREIAPTLMDTSGPQEYMAVQQAFDAGCPEGQRWYSKSQYLDSLPDDALGKFIEGTESFPGAFSLAYLEPLGGAIGDVSSDASAMPHRKACYSFNILAGWPDKAQDSEVMDWARSFHESMVPFSNGGVYVNLLSEDEKERIPSAYGANFGKLQEQKRKWDPNNVFRRTYNVSPD